MEILTSVFREDININKKVNMKKLIAISIIALLQGCAVLTASPSLPAYLSAHAAGVTAAATVGGIAVTAESLILDTKAIVDQTKK